MIAILKRYKIYLVLLFVVAIVSFNGGFDSDDPDYIEAQKNLVGTNGITPSFTEQAPITTLSFNDQGSQQNFQNRTVNPITGELSLVDTFTINAPGANNNGGSPNWAMFLDLIGGANSVIVTQMSTANGGGAGAVFSVEIFTRDGTALGGPVGSGPGSSPVGWTSLGTVPVTQGGTASGISLVFNIPPIMVAAGDTVGVAIKFNIVGPRYTGTGTPPYSVFSDANLTVVTGDGRSVPFTTGGTFFSSRALTGVVRYVINAPPVNCSYSWSIQTSGTTALLYSVKAVSDLVGWAAGAGAVVRRTIDGGTTWGNGNPNPGVIVGDIYNIEALDGNTAFVTTSGASTFIYKTINGGTNWVQVYTIAGGFINTIRMVSATNGYAFGDPVGGNWLMLRTVDGGSTWTTLATVAGTGDGRNNCLHISLPDIWFGTGQNTVWHSTNSGSNWTSAPTTGITGQVTGIQFNTSSFGLVGGATMSKTTDGGATFALLAALGTGTITGIEGSNTNYWYTRGTGIYYSTNEGGVWTQVHTQTAAQNDISLVTGGNGCMTGWSAGTGGTISKMTGAVVGINDPISQIPNTYKLEQNYPNPFNPTTNIKFGLPTSGIVKLVVFDVLGREVSTLVNEFKTAGIYTVDFNASMYSSGVYFYRIESGNFVETKKMLLVK